MEGTVQTSSGLKPMVIAVILKGSNYTLWSRTIKTAICGKGLWAHILEERKFQEGEDEEKKDQATKDAEAKWFQEDQSVLGFLHNSLEPSILEAYSYCESAKQLWDTLKRVYGNVSNLNRVYEVKKAINDLNQEEMELKQYLGKFQSLWSELDALRPSSLDPKVLNERREQDKTFGLLLNLNPAYNDVIKSILRETKLPDFEDVCARLDKEEGSIGLFGGKKELATANKGVYKPEDKKATTCDHCHKKGHIKEKCWILNPHLKPAKFKDHKESKANISQGMEQAGSSSQGQEIALQSSVEYVKKSDLEDLIKA